MLGGMSSPPILWGLTVSPWTEKARWVLDHHQVGYRYREHLPLIGELGLRWRARERPPGARATVPLLVDGRHSVCDSDAIARYIERRPETSTPTLFPSEHEGAIARWEREVGAAMHAARVLLTQALLHDPEAQIEMLPPQIPSLLRRPLRPVALTGVSFIARKHDAGADQIAASTRALTQFAERLREALAAAPFVLGDRFTWADVGAAMVVNGFAGGVPGRFDHWPASAGTWTRPELVREFDDLIAWRDRVYAEHRPASAELREP
jgi:glutathione S-transferase